VLLVIGDTKLKKKPAVVELRYVCRITFIIAATINTKLCLSASVNTRPLGTTLQLMVESAVRNNQ